MRVAQRTQVTHLVGSGLPLEPLRMPVRCTTLRVSWPCLSPEGWRQPRGGGDEGRVHARPRWRAAESRCARGTESSMLPGRPDSRLTQRAFPPADLADPRGEQKHTEGCREITDRVVLAANCRAHRPDHGFVLIATSNSTSSGPRALAEDHVVHSIYLFRLSEYTALTRAEVCRAARRTCK